MNVTTSARQKSKARFPDRLMLSNFKGFDAKQYNLALTSSLIGTTGGKRRISSNFLPLLISPNRTHTPVPRSVNVNGRVSDYYLHTRL